ncbi:antitoxin [Streptomyces sp. BG9H]|uniref:Antitoxin n=1 Tax=Streptomyces anatolicus TaxID=2675858 RepID=A0ABS6YID3_9ACTN|nr:antitoxin [Streptomyces anatolicus]MBW5421163.1 antitoxin [Streptomyces anatolicus]
MGFLDQLKAKLAPAKDKVSDLAQQHEDKIDHGLDKAAKMVDRKTKGKYSDKIQMGTGKAKDAVGRLAEHDRGKGAGAKDNGGTAGPPTPPSPPAPPPAP